MSISNANSSTGTAITASTLTTTGDIVYASSASNPARLGIGTTGQVLTVAGGIPSWATPSGGGKVLQVVQGTMSTEAAISTTTITTTNLTATITPTSATSKILVMVTQYAVYVPGTDAQGGGWYLYKNGSNISTLNLRLLSASARQCAYLAMNYLDAPATTSATTYALYGRVIATTSNIYFQADNSFSTITLLEIGA